MPAPGWLSMGDPAWLRMGDPGVAQLARPRWLTIGRPLTPRRSSCGPGRYRGRSPAHRPRPATGGAPLALPPSQAPDRPWALLSEGSIATKAGVAECFRL